MKLTLVQGNRFALDGGLMFGGIPKALWSNWIEPDSLNRIPLASNCLLIQHDGKNTLLEVGIGNFFNEKLRDRFAIRSNRHDLIDNLEKLGISEDKIDYIVLSHLHFDHCAALFYPGCKQLHFPKAKIFVGKRHWERAVQPKARDKASYRQDFHALMRDSGRLEFLEQEHHPTFGENFRFFYSDGHAPGLVSTEIVTNEGPVTFVSDLLQGSCWVHLPITMGLDRFPELLVKEKEKFLTDAEKRGVKIVFPHDIEMPLATVYCTNGRWEAKMAIL